MLQEEVSDTISTFNADCMEVMRSLDDESVDCLVTDPPYRIVGGGVSLKARKDEPRGILQKRFTMSTSNADFVRKGKLFLHNNIRFSDWVPEAFRILKQGAHAYIMCNGRNMRELLNAATGGGLFTYQQLLVWDKGNATLNKWYMNAVEFILMVRKGHAVNINNMGTKNLLSIPNVRGKAHPTEKPVELMKVMVGNSTKPWDVVIDPFMGVGSTGLACKELGRRFIGCELDKQYYDIAVERLKS